jgi:hypothetical protein
VREAECPGGEEWRKGHDPVAGSPESAWRVLQWTGLLSRSKGQPSRKLTGFERHKASPALAHRCFLHQLDRQALLPHLRLAIAASIALGIYRSEMRRVTNDAPAEANSHAYTFYVRDYNDLAEAGCPET